jgi:hypothetical protein
MARPRRADRPNERAERARAFGVIAALAGVHSVCFLEHRHHLVRGNFVLPRSGIRRSLNSACSHAENANPRRNPSRASPASVRRPPIARGASPRRAVYGARTAPNAHSDICCCALTLDLCGSRGATGPAPRCVIFARRPDATLLISPTAVITHNCVRRTGSSSTLSSHDDVVLDHRQRSRVALDLRTGDESRGATRSVTS